MGSSHETGLDSAPAVPRLPAGLLRVSRMTLCRAAFVMMCFAPQLRYLMPVVGQAILAVGALMAYVSVPWHRLSRSSIFFAVYFIAFGAFGLFVQLLGEVPPSSPPARPRIVSTACR